MKSEIKIGLGILVGIFALIFLVNEFEIFGMRFWGTRREDAKREIFENTQSYVQGKKQDLIKYHHEWVNADETGKKAIESTVRHAFAEYDEEKPSNKLPDELYTFLKKCKYQ